MKISLFCILVFFVLFSNSSAFAESCTGTAIQTGTIRTLLNGNTICTNDSQEQHRNGVEVAGVLKGDLWDFKKGAGDPVDPTSQVGTWEIHDDKVYYTYGSSTYANTVYVNGTNICFDNGQTITLATKKDGIVGCQ